jgi:hypothetical protein
MYRVVAKVYGPEDESPWRMVFSAGGMTVTLNEAEARMFEECVASIDKLCTKRAGHGPLSRRAATEFLRDAILSILAKTRLGQPSQATARNRIPRASRELRKRLRETLREWSIATVVEGFDLASLPVRFGRVEFRRATAHERSILAKKLRGYAGTGAGTKERATRIESMKKVIAPLARGTIAAVTVRALDESAARTLGEFEVRRTVDVLNAFVHRLAPAYHDPGIRIAPRVADALLPRIVEQVAPPGDNWLGFDPYRTTPFRLPRLKGVVARSAGLTRAHDILNAPTRGDLEDRIVTALAWAGRAAIETRKDQRFINYSIALDGLLAHTESSSGLQNAFDFASRTCSA